MRPSFVRLTSTEAAGASDRVRCKRLGGAELPQPPASAAAITSDAASDRAVRMPLPRATSEQLAGARAQVAEERGEGARGGRRRQRRLELACARGGLVAAGLQGAQRAAQRRRGLLGGQSAVEIAAVEGREVVGTGVVVVDSVD